MRKAAIIFGILVVLVVAGALALPYLFDVNRYHGRIQAEVQKRLGRAASLGPMRLSLLPFAIQVQGATIAEDSSFGEGKVFARADRLYVRADLIPLLRGDVRLRSLELERPQIELVRNAGGVWNFASLGHDLAEVQQKPQEFALDQLRIQDGQVTITDDQKQQPRTIYDHIDLAIEDYRPGQPFLVALAAHLPGAGKQTAQLNAKVGPIFEKDGEKNMLLTPIDGKLKLDEVSIAAVQRFLNVQALAGIDGITSGEASVKSLAGDLASNGSLRIEQGRVRGVDIGYPITADYEIQDELTSGVIRIKQGTLKLGATPLSVTGVINTAPAPAQIDLRVWTPEASIAEMARLASAFGVAFDPGTQIEGRVQADVQAKGAATQPLLNGTLRAKNLTISGKGLKQPVQVQGVQLVMTPEAVRSNDFAATTAGTTVAVQFALTQYTTANPQVQASVRSNRAQLDDVLNIARAYGARAVEGMSGSGRLSLDLRAAGALKNASAMALSGTGALENAKLTMPSLGAPLSVRRADIRFTQNSAVLQNFAGALGDTNATGTVTLKNFAAPQIEFALAVDKLNLNDLSTWFRKPADAGLTPQAESKSRSAGFQQAVGRGKVTVGTILYGEMTMSNARADATLDHGVVRLSPITAEVYGGVQNGSIVIDTRTNPIQYAVNTRIDRVDANKLLSSTTSVKQILYGLLMANANTTFRSGGSSDQIASSLNGDLALDLRNGKIANMDLWYEIANAGRFLATGQRMKPFTDLLSLTGNFNVQNGVAQTNNLKAVIDGATVFGAGAVNLADQSLNMRVTAVLSKERSQEVGGSGIGGFMMTALADQNGQLILPVIISGTFSTPRFTPDVQRIAEMRLQQTISDPLGTAGGILGTIFGSRKDRQAPATTPPQQNQPANSEPPPEPPK
ncbi:MAG: AsmA family protein [Acidobacteriota bacterium]|nr:AsmA family protein [Acidobacteriota bacterium]